MVDGRQLKRQWHRSQKLHPKLGTYIYLQITFRSKRYQDKQKEKKAKMLEKMSTDNDVPKHNPFKKKY